MIYLVGDIHGDPISKMLCLKNDKKITNKDIVIQVGDFGCIFSSYPTEREIKNLDWLEQQSWTTLFIDGNHENFERLFSLKTIKKYGNSVGVVRKNVFYLKRGNVYNIDGKKFLAFGGANSIDKSSRVENVNWWKQEIPSHKDFDNCLNNLEKNNFEIDYIISHTMPTSLTTPFSKFYSISYFDDDMTRKYLEEIIQKTKFKKLFFGHWHYDWSHNNIYYLLYNQILTLDVDKNHVYKYFFY